MRYRHAQQPAVYSLLTVIALAGASYATWGGDRNEQHLWLPLLIIAGVCWTLGKLTISVNGQLQWHYRYGLFKRSVNVADIAQVTQVRTSPIWGFGIHFTNRGWLYNNFGLDAVRVELNDGRTFTLGTDQPQQLVNALQTRS